MAWRNERLTLRLEAAQQTLEEHQAKARALQARLEQEQRERQALEWILNAQAEGERQVSLQGRRILYVGGLKSHLANLRRLVQRWQGELIDHDGGQEDNRILLRELVAQADWILCPLDRVSHDAVHRLKRECRHHGKPCLLLPRSSLSAFVQGLQALAGKSTAEVSSWRAVSIS
ncbi:hypothetical protein MIT9_P0883 [Methylomarinovum caldicuralii]|uniref:DUF2325 domain-containing protein n=1 Tax=Methylomarinovum caldicuralii TaxID=438856 RepID=A0AAU9CE82_9GAMM|nr:DUF2325 domain-containing protein [Methylomarinovum caldicuralii]BCX81305.1 hypothetical protein MIT9_P0883 [Methylomarinovum caldicuralii]